MLHIGTSIEARKIFFYRLGLNPFSEKTFDGYGFGTVTRITPSYVYINNDKGETIRKSPEKVRRLR